MWIHIAIYVSAIIVGVLTGVYLYLRRNFSFWSDRGVSFKKPHFLFGNFAGLVTKKEATAKIVVDLYNEFKDKRFGGAWLMFSPQLFLVDLDLIRDVLVKDFVTWSSRGMIVNPEVDPLSEHVAGLDGKKWKIVRTKLTPTFSSAKLKHMYHLLLECGKDFEKYLDTVAAKGEPVEAADLNAKFTTDVIGSCVFGIQMNALNDEDALFRKMGKKMFAPTFRSRMINLIQNSFPWLFRFLKLSTILREVSDFFIKLTKETFEYREKNNVQRYDFMDLLRNLKNTGKPIGEDEVEFDDKLLAAQAVVFFGAGFETSSTTISYCLHELAVNQDIQNRLREEVHKTKAESGGEITWDGLRSMNYLEMIFRETLRKYPIAPLVQRMSVKPYRIPGTNVELPAGSKAIIPLYAIHHDPDYYPDPEKFDPERFTEEAKSRRPAFTYLPFGDGPRICIGLRFAELQTKMAIIKIVDNFKVSLCEKSQHPLRFRPGSQLLQPENGFWIQISRNVSAS